MCVCTNMARMATRTTATVETATGFSRGWLLELFGDQYVIVQSFSSPDGMGWPVARPRTIVFMLAKGCPRPITRGMHIPCSGTKPSGCWIRGH